MMHAATAFSGLLCLLAACDTAVTAPAEASMPQGTFTPGKSRLLYGIDSGDVDCATLGSRRPGNMVCGYTRDGREVTAEITVEETRIGADSDLPVGDPRFWQALVTDMERRAQAASEPGVTRLQAEIQGPLRPPVANADACLRYRLDRRQGETVIDNEGVRCAFFDPETRIVDVVLVEYVERRTGRPRAPGFSREADAIIATLSRKPKASP